MNIKWTKWPYIELQKLFDFWTNFNKIAHSAMWRPDMCYWVAKFEQHVIERYIIHSYKLATLLSWPRLYVT